MPDTTRIAVTGATGRVGRHIVAVLESRGFAVAPIARATGVDVITGEGLEQALEGAEAIVDAATGPSPEEQSATEFFTTAAHNLQGYGQRVGVKRIVSVSIIGVDQFTAGYGAAKIAHERELHSGPIPVSILRAAQFHEFLPQVVDWGRQGEVSYVRRMRTQLVAARTVAEQLVEMATGPEKINGAGSSANTIPEIAGPRAEDSVEMARLLVARRGAPVQIEGVTDPSDPDDDLYLSGALLPGEDAILAGPTFEEWLASEAAA